MEIMGFPRKMLQALLFPRRLKAILRSNHFAVFYEENRFQ